MKIISHRGASGYAAENTLKAFRLAVEMGAKSFEFDVHQTKDGILVVHHDCSLKSTAGKDVKIASLTYPELKKFNIAAHFKHDKAAQHIPRLEEVINIIGPQADWLNVELKNDNNVYPGIEEKLLSFLLSKNGIFEKTVVSSFDYGTLKRCREVSPELKLAYLGQHLSAVLVQRALKKARAIGAVSFHMPLRLAFKLNVARIQKAGLRVYVYTVNTKKDALRMQAIGADGIFTNYPDILGKWHLQG